MYFEDGRVDFSRGISPGEPHIIFNIFDLIVYEALDYDNKSTEFYGRSFLEASNDIRNNSQRLGNDACVNIISIKKELKRFYKRKLIFPEKQRKKLLIQQLQKYFQQIKNNYLKKIHTREDWKNLSKKERDKINNYFVYRYLLIKQIELLAKSLIIKAIFPFRQ